jgi:hypothetical protein
MVADELRRQSDQFIDLADLEQLICRDPATRPPRTERAERFSQRRVGEGYSRSATDPVPFEDEPEEADDVTPPKVGR